MTATAERILDYLLVEDNDCHAGIIEQCIHFGKLPHRVHRVAGGAECLDYLRGEEPFANRTRHPYPDVVLMDIRMPGTLDGLQTLQAIRSDPRHHALVVMMLTTSESDRDVHRAYELGANGYIVKSVNRDEMIEKLLQMRWSFESLLELPHDERQQRADPPTEPSLLPPADVEELLQADEDRALAALASDCEHDRDGMFHSIEVLEHINGQRMASLLYHLCLEHTQLFASSRSVDLVFLRTIVMETLPRHLTLEQMAAVVAKISAEIRGNAWAGSNTPSWHTWQGFGQAYLSQTWQAQSGPT